MIGFAKPSRFREKVIAVLDHNGLVNPDTYEVLFDEEISKNSKITFHQSGIYKVTTGTKIKKGGIDRATIRGIPLNNRKTPTLMADIRLPNQLFETKLAIRNIDLVFDITAFPEGPKHCTISAMCEEQYQKFVNSRIINSSIIEETHGLISNGGVWAFTLWMSELDQEYPDIPQVYVPGQLCWPQNGTSD